MGGDDKKIVCVCCAVLYCTVHVCDIVDTKSCILDDDLKGRHWHWH